MFFDFGFNPLVLPKLLTIGKITKVDRVKPNEGSILLNTGRATSSSYFADGIGYVFTVIKTRIWSQFEFIGDILLASG